jgi:chromosome partitioning protein
MIIAFGGIKGGSGKTTLATNITYIRGNSGRKVLLVDADDDQWSASDWSEHREAQNIHTPWTTIRLSGMAVRTQLNKLKETYDDIFIDTGGRDSQSLRSAMSIADLFISPFQPRSYDVWTLGKLTKLVNEIKPFNPELQVYTVVNRGDVKGSDNEEAKEMLSEFFKTLPVIVCQRKAFSNSAAQGLSVLELEKPDPLAINEINCLYGAIYAQ